MKRDMNIMCCFGSTTMLLCIASSNIMANMVNTDANQFNMMGEAMLHILSHTTMVVVIAMAMSKIA